LDNNPHADNSQRKAYPDQRPVPEPIAEHGASRKQSGSCATCESVEQVPSGFATYLPT
jgi:hypothetical protein